MRDRVQPLEQVLHIGGEIERVGNDDDIEAAVAELNEFTGLREEFGAGQAQAGGRDLGFRQINARLFPGAETREQFAGAAADFEHAGVRRNEEIVVVGQQRAVGVRTRLRLRGGGIVERADALEMFAGKGGDFGGHVDGAEGGH